MRFSDQLDGDYKIFAYLLHCLETTFFFAPYNVGWRLQIFFFPIMLDGDYNEMICSINIDDFWTLQNFPFQNKHGYSEKDLAKSQKRHIASTPPPQKKKKNSDQKIYVLKFVDINALV